MKRFLLFSTIVVFGFYSQAQNEFSPKFKAIPAAKVMKPKKQEITEPNRGKDEFGLKSIKAPNVFESPDLLFNPPPPAKTYQFGKKDTFSMLIKNDFANPAADIEERLNKKNESEVDASLYRRNQNLGDYRTTTAVAQIMYRDAEFVDGDMIRVYLNDKVIQSNIMLGSTFKGVEMVLNKGFNKIDFEAINQGTSGPNTAEFRVYDEKGGLISASVWNLGTGFKATLLLIKE